MNEINLDSFICYNWMPIISDHCLDLDEEFYRAAGVTRLHEQGRINADQIKDGDVVFIKTDYLYNGDFQKHIFPRIKNRFILVSGISSYHIGSNGDKSFIDMLNSPKLIKWFCTNPPDYKSDKIVPLPIGFEEKERPGGNQQSIADFYENRTDFKNKKDKILLPYHTLETNPERKNLFEAMSQLPFVETQKNKLSWSDYMNLVDEYKFVICLEGSGPDVHRNYECMLVGTLPINVRNTIHTLFDYHDLPGIFINKWSDLTQEMFDSYCKTGYNTDNVKDFLKIRYHSDLINSIKVKNEG